MVPILKFIVVLSIISKFYSDLISIIYRNIIYSLKQAAQNEILTENMNHHITSVI